MNQDKPASEQLDLETTTDQEIVNPDKLNKIARELERVPDSDVSSFDSEYLANLVAAVKRLENAAEEARKDGYEDELDTRVEAGETIGPVTKQTGSSSYVTDTEGAFAAVAETGEDPLQLAKINIGDLRDTLGNRADEYIGTSEYTYYRRTQ